MTQASTNVRGVRGSSASGTARVQPPRVRIARLLVLGLLLLNVPTALALTASQLVWSSTTTLMVSVLLLVAYAIVQASALHAAVTPWATNRRRHVVGIGLAVLTVALAVPLALTAEPGAVPWAWVAGFSIGALVVLHSSGWGMLLVLGVGLGGGALSVAVGSPVRDVVVFTLITAGAVASMGALVVWLLTVLVQSETGREAQVMLAVTQERLRLTRDLHDILVQSLTVIALKAELAEEQAADPMESARRAREIHTLAGDTLRETRLALRGYDTLDLTEQLRTAELVLSSAGIIVHVDAVAAGPAADASHYLAAVVREGVTNVLRHSDAQTCSITLERTDQGTRLRIINDRPHPPSGSAGMGLRGLRQRGDRLGAQLRTEMVADEFVLQAELRSVPR